MLEASAGVLYIIGPLYNPVVIDSGAVLEFGVPNNNTNGSGGFVDFSRHRRDA